MVEVWGMDEVARIVFGVAYLPLILGHIDFWIKASSVVRSFGEIGIEGDFGNLKQSSQVCVSILCCLVGRPDVRRAESSENI